MKKEHLFKAIKSKINSIQGNIFLKFTLIYCIITLIFYSVLSITAMYTFTSEARSSSEREIAALSSSIDSTISHLYDYSITTSLNDTLIKTAMQYPDPPASESQQYAITQTVNSILNSIIGLNSSISNWDILSSTGKFFNLSGFDMSNIQGFDSQTILTLHKSRLTPCISGPFLLQDNAISSSDKEHIVFILSKPIVRLDLNQTCGYVIFLIDSSILTYIFEEYLPESSSSSFYILDSEENILLSSDRTLTGLTFDSNQINFLSQKKIDELLESHVLSPSLFDKNALVYSLRELNDISWKIITSYPLEAFMEEQRILSNTILAMVFLALVAFLVAAFIIASSISRPLHALSQHMKKISEASYETITIPKTLEEVEHLYQGYNYMMNKTNSLLDSIYEEQAEKAEYQFKLLQSQIKPHFLYNTLEMIKSMIDLGINASASQALTTLSSFYRLSLSRGADIISIKDEMEISENYLALEKMRHPEYFDYSIECPPELYFYLIPKLTLQPILENSVIHGMTSYCNKGLIEIKVSEKCECLEFIIEDNGQGMTESQLKNLGSNLDNKQMIQLDSFGLSNINRRLKLIYGSQYNIKIQSQQGQFTRVILTIPKIEPHGGRYEDNRNNR